MAAIKYLWDVDTIDPSDTTRFGGKASGLARMRQMGLPVPPAVVISTDAFKAFYENGGRLPASLSDEIDTAIHLLEQRTGRSSAAVECRYCCPSGLARRSACRA